MASSIARFLCTDILHCMACTGRGTVTWHRGHVPKQLRMRRDGNAVPNTKFVKPVMLSDTLATLADHHMDNPGKRAQKTNGVEGMLDVGNGITELLDDIEKLCEHLRIEHWVVFGGS